MSQPFVGFFQRNNFSRKKLHLVAKHCNEQLRLSFVSDCEIYTPEMLVFVAKIIEIQ